MNSGITKLLAILLLFCTLPKAHAQLSPGDLAEPHQALEGISNCTNCHELGEGPSAAKCLDCHVGLKKRVDNNAGYHNLLVNVQKKVCFECHSEHAGRDFELIRWPEKMEKFDHEQTGFRLTGKHAKVICRDCHNPALIRKITDPESDRVDLTSTFLGLDTNCTSCHVDRHFGQLGDNCTKCHTQDSFKPAVGFDHAKTVFPLAGKHAQVECGKCHPTVGAPEGNPSGLREFIKYSGIAFNNCTSCHKDIHAGKFGDNCTKCHSTEGWKKIFGESFDHDKTRYPLRGMHRDLKCDKCHRSDKKTGELKFALCTDCHRDRHAGQFSARPDGGKCEACHDVNAFLPAHFGAIEHEQTDFKLLGAHRAQPCIACHKQVGEGETSYRLYTLKSDNCIDCHTDYHAGQFVSGEKSKTCLDCHSIDQWRIEKFDHNQKSSYALTGAHARVACTECHKSETIGEIATVRYRPLKTNCENCHRVAVTEAQLREG